MVQLKQFGKYEILRKLGRSMTDVYLARDPGARRNVVLKLIEESRDPFTQLVIEAERRGAQIQKQLREIDPRTLEIYEFGEQNGCFFVAMEYVAGRNIAEVIRIQRRIEPKQACRYAMDVLSQLHRLHSFVSDVDGRLRAVVHGDIKPSNIQIAENGDVRLLDFGIAKVITYTHNLTHHNLGSPTYCSPERLAKGQVDPHADLWALGVSLYEMVSGSLPYQAQSTRKLENLIQSRRPPRALPADCPAGLRAIISKALAADMTRRYPSAPEFEDDLRAFVEGRATTAESEKLPSWDANETLQKTLDGLGPAPVTRVREAADRLKMAWLAAREFFDLHRVKASILWAIGAGILFGLFAVMPLSYAYNFRTESRPLRAADYTRRSAAAIDADWTLYKRLERDNSFLGGLSPAGSLTGQLRRNLIAAADAVIDGYRNSSDPSLSHFDWAKARACLTYALHIDPADIESHGKLALTDGYMNLIENPQLPKAQQSETSFQIAASDIPRSPDPHLALARLYTYVFKNAGKALGEFTEAERRGFRSGPREFEQQADGYLYRAQYALRQAQRETALSNERNRWLGRAHADLERARKLYEPMAGFSNVNTGLEQLDRDRDSEERLRTDPGQADRKMRMKRPGRRRLYETSMVWQ